MSRSSHIFSDRIVNVAMSGPLIRIELGAMQAPTGDGQKPQLVPTETVVMPLDGFVQSFSLLDAVMKRLVADGVVKLQTPEAEVKEIPAAS